MKNIVNLSIITILLFVISMDFIFYTNFYYDLLIVIIYVFIIARNTLNLETKITDFNQEFVLKEKKTALFSPLIFLFFLSTSINYGTVVSIINILVICLLYGYVFISFKRNKITVDQETIEVEYLNGKKTTMKWSEIVEIDFDWIYNLIIFTNKNNEQLKLDISLADFLGIILMIKARFLKADYEKAFQKLSNYYRLFLINTNNIYLK